MHQPLLNYTLHLADNALILGHRLSEWCGHGPVLEQDIAMTNIALDLVGQARLLYQYAADIEGAGKTEDDLAYLRDATAFRNLLLVEQPNTDFGYTIARQFLYDSFAFHFYQALSGSSDSRLADIAAKSLKETTYHLRWSSEWVLRLGDGTDESHQRIQQAFNDLWMYSGEFFIPTDWEKSLAEADVAVQVESIRPRVEQQRRDILLEATLNIPADTWMQRGGKEGRHTEHLGYILAEMQFLQRAYPGQEW